jgi:NAD(P)-dependent dehydrogenase (short-subunit alcohol dehydrogenase family)
LGQTVEEFLKATEIIDWTQPLVSSKARELSTGLTRAEDIARHCFEWVRDEIQHSSDFKRNPVTCRTSDVLAADTPFHEVFSTPEMMRNFVAIISLGRVGTPIECAKVIAFLASDAASYVVGQTIEVNGGSIDAVKLETCGRLELQ